MAEEREIKAELETDSFKEVLNFMEERFSTGIRKSYLDEYYDFPDLRFQLKEHILRFRADNNQPLRFDFKTIFYLPARVGKEWFVDEETIYFPTSNFIFFNNLFIRLGGEIKPIQSQKELTMGDVKRHLEQSGLTSYLQLTKQRVIFQRGKTKFMVDYIDNLGLFIETESNDPAKEFEKIALPFKYKFLRTGYTNLYLQRTRNVLLPDWKKYLENPRWNVLHGEEKLYEVLNKK